MTSILVAGVGNIFLGDDGFGVEVVRRLHERRSDPWPPDVRVIDYGIRGIDLYYALLDGVDLAVLVDATHRDGPPGTLYVIEPSTPNTNEDFTGDATPVLLSAHDLDAETVVTQEDVANSRYQDRSHDGRSSRSGSISSGAKKKR